ncbi:MAG TPA: hypothetical protein VMN60_13030 [Longimicrobiales bacterium]|nr:hypothetical protein [Longimicrobiales bacterium]
MRAAWILMIAAGAALSAVPANVAAQGRSGQTRQEQLRAEQQRAADRGRVRQERERDRQRQLRSATTRNGVYIDPRRTDDRDDRRDDRGRDARDSRGRSVDNGNGPPFCRNGAGHPVHGHQWCLDKGFGLGGARDVFGDIVFRQPRDRRYDQQTLGRSVLSDMLGAVVLGRFETLGRRHGTGPLTGRWLNDYGTRTLQLSVGSVPIARLVDTNRDGRVDDIVLRR